MDELFGVSVGGLAQVFGVIFAVIAAGLVFIVVRDNILVRMALRNVLRRPARSVLIIVGLMLATAIISSAFTTGDSVTFSIKRSATNELRSVDEIIRIDDDSEVWAGKALPNEFSEDVFHQVGPQLESASDVIDGVLPALVESTSVINFRTRQFDVEAIFTGLDPARAAGFDTLRDRQGRAVDLASLGPDEVYVNEEGAEEIGAQAGDVLGVALGPGDLSRLTIKSVVDGWYFRPSGTKVVLMVPLTRAQELLGRPGLISVIAISNRGDTLSGVDLTPQVLQRFGDLPELEEAGLEVFGLKQDIVDIANDVGSVFVSLFTTFGLFSIGVGLLLIFLIFTMLAAERKSEMGISRAVGMERRHLVRLFMAEGAVYSLGSAAVGALIGIGLGYLLVLGIGEIFNQESTEDFGITAHVELRSLLLSFFFGSVITFITVIIASWRISKLNIVRAIRDIPEPRVARAGKATLFWGVLITLVGVIVLFTGLSSAHLTAFGLGVSFIPVGVSLILRWKGVAQRWVLTGTGVILLAWWLLPPSVYNRIKDDWNQDFSIFFVSGALVVAGAVLLIVNNSPFISWLATGSLTKVRSIAPIVKSAVSYPLRFGFRTGLSIAMFAVVIFSVVVMSTILEGFNKLWEDQERLAGGYDVMAFAQGDLNPVLDLSESVESNPELAFVSRVEGKPAVGTFRAFGEAEARLSSDEYEELLDTVVTGVDDDFIDSNRFQMKLAAPEYTTESGVDHPAVWRDLVEKPGLAVVNALLVPTRNTFNFGVGSEDFSLQGVEGLFLENETMDPVDVTVLDLKSGSIFELTVIGVLDDFASNGTLPFGIFTSTNTLRSSLPREIDATQFFFKVNPGTQDPAEKVEAALFQHGLQAIDAAETIDDLQGAQRSFFNLVIAFMTLGLVVGIAALGVISARAVVERRHEIGVMRAIGYSRAMVQMTFLAESSFIAVLGIGLGLALGLATSANIASDISTDEANFGLVIPWAKVLLIGLGAYLISVLATYLPSRQAAAVAPAEALRYE